MVDVNYVLLLFVAIVVALAYGLIGLFAAWAQKGESFEPRKFIATIIYSIALGIIAVNLGLISLTNVTLDIFNPLWLEYAGLLYVVNKVVDTVFDFFTKKVAAKKLAGGVISVQFDVTPKGVIKVGDRVTVTDILKNLVTVDFGDGVIWGWETTDTPGIAYHEYKAPGKYTIRGVGKNGDNTGYATAEIIVYGSSVVEPTEPKGYWEKLMDSIWTFIKAILGRV
jgi:hypothetical protein